MRQPRRGRRRKWLIDDKNLSWPFYPENEVMESTLRPLSDCRTLNPPSHTHKQPAPFSLLFVPAPSCLLGVVRRGILRDIFNHVSKICFWSSRRAETTDASLHRNMVYRCLKVGQTQLSVSPIQLDGNRWLPCIPQFSRLELCYICM